MADLTAFSKSVLDQMEMIEHELKKMNLWTENASSVVATLDSRPVYTMAEYLQYVFLALQNVYALKTRCMPSSEWDIKMAEVVFGDKVEFRTLKDTLLRYDRFIKDDLGSLRTLSDQDKMLLKNHSSSKTETLKWLLEEIKKEMLFLEFWIDDKSFTEDEKNEFAFSMEIDRSLQFGFFKEQSDFLETGTSPQMDPSYYAESSYQMLKNVPKAQKLSQLILFYVESLQENNEVLSDDDIDQQTEIADRDELWLAEANSTFVNAAFDRAKRANPKFGDIQISREVMADLMLEKFRKMMNDNDMLETEVYCSFDFPKRDEPFLFFFRGYGSFYLQDKSPGEIKSTLYKLKAILK